VRRWIASGITPGGTRLLGELRDRLKAQDSEERNKRQTFDLLLKLAGERSIEHQEQALKEGKPYKWNAGDKPTARAREGVRAGPRTSGFQWVKRVQKMLTEGLIVDIAVWMSSKRRRFPLWQAAMVVSEYSKRKFMNQGSNSLEAKNLLFQVPNVPESGDFLTNEVVATRRNESLSEVRDDLVAKLEDAIEEGSMVYIHEVTLFNYRMRTETERLAWESGKRMGRKRRAKRRRKPSKIQVVRRKKVEVWPTTSKKKKTSKKSSKPSKVSTKEKRRVKTPTKAKSKKSGESRSRNASTQSRHTGSSLPLASAKKSAPRTSGSRSRATTSKKSTKKLKSSLGRSKSRATFQTPTRKTPAKKAKKAKKARHS